MPIISQNRRLFTLTTPLGPDAFVMTGFSGREELSRPFSFNIDIATESTSVAPADLVGKEVGWSVNYPVANPRYFHGYVRKLVAGPPASRTLRPYRAEVVPWLWFLNRATDCRIFQEKTVPEIIKDVFTRYGFSSVFKESYKGTYPKREYCVQYRETAFDFVSRLMEEYGIFYTFTFANGSHTMVLADDPSAYADCAPHAKVEFRPESRDAEAIYRWDHAYEFRSGKVAHTDYNFETPSTSLLKSTQTVVSLTGISSYEVFDYPGRYVVAGDGEALAKVRMQEIELGYDTANGASRCSSFIPGGKFTLDVHPTDNANYVILGVEHVGVENSVAGTQSGTADYRNEFLCAPSKVPYRPARLTPRPRVFGPQPAAVVGPSGEEIYTDKYGRIKVQFFWDRVGTKNENSSCWMRVAEMWAGQNWGMVFTPRIGQEVLIEFLEGDPDQPIVTGRVYNAEQMPPYALPANMTQSGVKTRSTKGGGAADFNELRFEDKKDNEDIYFHAQKDFHRLVEHDDDLKVGNDQTIEIKNNRTEVVKDGHETITIEKGNRTETVKVGNELITIEKGNRAVVVSKGNDSHKVETGNRVVEIKTDDTLTVDSGNRLVTVKTGNDTHTVKTGNREVTIELGNDTLTVKTGNQTVKLNAGASSTEAMQSITLKVGGSEVKIDQSGVSIKGMNIKIEGSIATDVKGLMTTVEGSAMNTIKGGIVQIN